MTVESDLTGVALDATVFERVFGEKIKCAQGIQCADIPPFSEDIASAWTVVERLLEQRYEVTVSGLPGWEFGCRIAPLGAFNTPDVVFVSAATATLAICLAALKALGWPTY